MGRIKTILFSVLIRIIVAVFLFWALDRHDYAYYTFLRWITCGAAIYFTYIAYENGRNVWTWILGIMALIFNPIIPFHLDRDTWTLIDLISGVLILISLFFVKQSTKTEYTEEDAIIDLVVENEKELEDITDDDILAKIKEKKTPKSAYEASRGKSNPDRGLK